MKIILFTIIILTSINSFGQYTYLAYDKEDIDKEYATYYHDFYEINGKYVDSIFYMNGQPFEIIELKSLYPYIKEGTYKSFYRSGELNYLIDYKDDIKHGYMTGYYSSGQILRKDYYENDSLISGACFSVTGNDTIYFPHMIFPNFNYKGITDFKEYIYSNLEYPIDAAEKGITGQVVLQFVIDTSGYLTDVRVKRSTNPIFNESAYRAIKKSPRWEPALRDGKKTKQLMTVPIKYFVERGY